MNTQTKAIIKSGLFSGIVYAGLMAGFDYSDGQDFRIWRFILNALFFGIFMGFMTRYNLKKQADKEKNKTE
ncbi:hypothetical protein DFQ11_1126 [Winogradskyella epiphytica]|jgi:hypothetical protein|uniref:Uncharacterized protein n=1 Tax=Winogradskyella epiphytica TaxID=262005 RepID=A0A2V4XW55_9FLAO|nr:hypothetical protein [Winogradskyella epiphytica]PYE79260.1 hypothetical protein DFQ11_1126 [Winogradskyella epiphytica]GGW74512.1 hypothetical protein GCM10008085_28280 [Winogradskyella epiphytica]